MWCSRKLAAVQPAWARPEYAWWYPLAGANGVFELDLRAIWAKCYAYARPDRTLEDMQTVRDSFARAKLLFVWEQDRKCWAFWVGSNKPGRRPPPSWLKREAENGRLGPDPPEEALRAFLRDSEAAPASEYLAAGKAVT